MDRSAPCLAVILALGLAAPAVAIDTSIWKERLDAVLAAAPPDVVAFVTRARGCKHFAGEPDYDKERRDFLYKTLTELKCDQLDAAEVALRRKYAGSLPAQRALDVRGGEVAP
jgi:hypothetical protein